MNRRETDTIIAEMKNILDGNPWFGRSVFSILNEIHPAMVYKKPNEDAHSIIELLYHMITWAQFTLNRLNKLPAEDEDDNDSKDWRLLDPLEHTWTRGLKELRNIHEEIIRVLQSTDDRFLDEPVDFRKYNFRVLLNGLNQHNIYHLGQIAYIKKWFVEKE